ncbi:MAG: UDP-N-acetylmuramate--L-alanine ligase [Saprospiraceae bacterium]|nr:UDP-N-acetylmuramate--L-alanine ligase [Saprospiraceae bacterium]
MQLNDIHTIYFIGIGGIGMSALARYFRGHGARVYGYDRTETALTKAMVAEGMQVHYDDDVRHIPENVDLVVWTPAVPQEHSELAWFRAHNIPVKKRAEVLGLISKDKRCIAVAGTHGKTTTSTIAAYLLRSCGVDATAFLGGISANLGSNFVEGKSEWVVVEADEYDRSFLQLHPEIAILNSLDPDHLDIYGSPEAVVETYKQFIRQIKPGGILIYRHDLPIGDVVDELRKSGRHALSFGIDAGDYEATNLRIEDGQMVFDIRSSIINWGDLRFNYPGRHNVENATAAWAAVNAAGAFMPGMPKALAHFRGVKRRFEFIVRRPECVYIDDYAHHPTELQAAISAARMLFPDRRITGVFQPHLYSRTRDFADGFAEALDLLDECLLLPIYPAREKPIEGVHSEMILDKMNLSNKKIVTKEQVIETLQKSNPEILLTMGAGDIDTLIEPIRLLIEKKYPSNKPA